MHLDGVYVDREHCLVLVLPSVECDPEGNRIWRVHGTLPTDDNPAWCGSLVERAEDGGPHIRWVAASGDNAVCNSAARDAHGGVPRTTAQTLLTSIAWDNGETWTRVHLSAVHCYLLTARPYVPMTIVAIYTMRELAGRAYARVASLMGDRARKAP